MLTRPEGFVLFAAGYGLAVALSEHAYGSLAFPSPFWLPDSVLLVALLLAPRGRWWVFLAAIWPIRFLVGAPAGTPLWFLASTITNDALKAMLTAWLLGRLIRREIRLDTLNEFLVFLAVGVTLVPLLSALVAAPARYALGDPIWPSSYKWFLGDALAQVVVTPTLLFWCTAGYQQVRGRVAESVACLTMLAAALIGAFILDDSYSTSLLYVPVPFLVWAAIRLRPFGSTNAVTVVALITMIGTVRGAGAFANDPVDQAVLSLQLFLLALAVPLLLLSMLVTEQERLRQRETDFNSRLLEAQDRECARIARDLHDDFAQRMAVLHVGLESVVRTKGLPGGAEAELKTLGLIAEEMSSDLRDLSHRLHPATLDLVGLESALRTLCAEFGAQHGLQVDLRSRDVPPRLHRDVRICLFRVAQEGLHNVVKHSGATTATVELSRQGDSLMLCISDRGRGFDLAASNAGLGLISMRERLRAAGGRLVIASTPGEGTRVGAEVPVRIDAAHLVAPDSAAADDGGSSTRPDVPLLGT